MTPTIPRTADTQRAADLVLARDHFLPFVVLTYPKYKPNAVSFLLSKVLKQFMRDVEAGLSPRLILEIPPRIGKSELTSRKYPGWVLGHHPDWHIGLVSYGGDLATKLSREARTVVTSEVYAQIFARYETEEIEAEVVEIDKTAKAAHQWRIKPTKDNPQPGGMQAAGISGTWTGSGFHVLIIDDPHKDWKEAQSIARKEEVWDYYAGTLYDRLEPGGGIIVVMQRWAQDDLVGRLLSVDDTDEEGFEVEYLDKWQRIRLPAQAEAGEDDPLGRKPGEWLQGRYTTEQWERAKANNMKRNPRIWAAKFQQRPSAAEGVLFDVDKWIRFEDEPVDDPPEGPVFIFLDTSFAKTIRSDYNAATVWRMEKRRDQPQFRLLEVYHKRSQYPELKADMLNLCGKYGLFRPPNVILFSPRLFVEDTKSGQSLIQDFSRAIEHPQYGRVRIPIRAWHPKMDSKDQRAATASESMSSGRVVMPKKAPWLKDYLDELRSYQGEGSIQHDDQVDATSMALILMDVQEPQKRPGTVTHIPFRLTA